MKVSSLVKVPCSIEFDAGAERGVDAVDAVRVRGDLAAEGVARSATTARISSSIICWLSPPATLLSTPPVAMQS